MVEFITELKTPVAVEKEKSIRSRPIRYTYVEITSEPIRFVEFWSRKVFSYPMSRIFPQRSMNNMAIVGTSTGRLICMIRCRRLAPSISAASRRLMSTPARAAK
ncbi:MAG: hypothetical protein FWD78_08880 [Treponema sp.]|nr:hypothetical protein [Treponema sp.]